MIPILILLALYIVYLCFFGPFQKVKPAGRQLKQMAKQEKKDGIRLSAKEKIRRLR